MKTSTKESVYNRNLPLEWTKNKTIYEVNIRQYTPEGTFAAFEKHLPRLKTLGVGILWFMPVQPIGRINRKGKLGSYYSISDYTGIHPDFGTLDEFIQLVNKIHQQGMFVLLDWVANHTAWDNIWTKEHPGFYVKDEQGNFMRPNADWTDVIKLDFDNASTQQAMIDAMKFWVKTVGVDGFRCDMAHLVPTSFWNKARKELEQVKPLFMLAESQNRDLLDKAFDMEYTWDFFHTLNDIANGNKNVVHIDERLQWDIFDFPRNRYQLFFTSNHDENSWQGSSIERLGDALEAISALVMTINGMPMIYNGQEAGIWKRLKFFDKDTIEWKDDKMCRFYRRLIALRKRNEALWSGAYGGDFERLKTTDNKHIFAFCRKKNNAKVVVILNLSDKDIEFTIENQTIAGIYQNVLTNERIIIGKKPNFRLIAWQYRVFEYQE